MSRLYTMYHVPLLHLQNLLMCPENFLFTTDIWFNSIYMLYDSCVILDPRFFGVIIVDWWAKTSNQL